MYFSTEHNPLQKGLEVFRPCFSKPQWNHFNTYIGGLVFGEKGEKNVADIAYNALDGKDQSSLNRFLAGRTWDSTRLENIRLSKLLRRRKGGVLSLDDVLVEKTGKFMEGVGWLHNPTEHRDVLAHDFVTTLYSNGKQRVPMHFLPYMKKEMCEGDNYHFKTKIQLGIELLRRALVYIKPEVVAFDEWYFCSDIVKFLKRHKQNWVTQTKTNRLVLKDGEWTSVRELFRMIDKSEYRRISSEVEEKRYRWCYEESIRMKKVGVVKLVFLKTRRNGRKFRVLVTNNLGYTSEEVIGYYKRRWDIEVFYRDCKQHLGMGDYQVRGLGSVVIHLQFVFLAYHLLKNRRSPGISRILKGIRAIGEICLRLKRWMFEKILSCFGPKPGGFSG